MIQRLLRRQEVEHVTGLKRSTIYELVAAGEFPKPVPISDWQKRCIASRDIPGA
jgi:predicted DNA-binding transcriptional regulator AlpA